MSPAPSPTLPMFAGEPPAGPSVRRARAPLGLVTIHAIAKATGKNPRTLKRTLLQLNTSMSGRLLVQLVEGGHWLVRLDILREKLPELVTPQVVDDGDDNPCDDRAPSEFSQAAGFAGEMRELREAVARLTDEVIQLRDLVVMLGVKPTSDDAS